MDRGTVIGLTATMGLLAWIMLAGSSEAMSVFWRLPSLALVIGGAILVTMAAVPLVRFRAFGSMLRKAFREQGPNPAECIAVLIALAELARREGLLSLERSVAGLKDGFLRRAMQMAIDGQDANMIESVLQTELESTDLRHVGGRDILRSMGNSAPVFGMIGTLIGLVIMLGRMDDPSTIGPGMAVALLTTLYGLLFANVVCLPLARKLGHRSSDELLCKTIMLKGVLAIQRGDHPRMVEQKLRAYLPDGGEDYEFIRTAPEPSVPSAGQDESVVAEEPRNTDKTSATRKPSWMEAA
ncbi:MAG: motility protein A [Phycisphaerales bacterium]|nr:motility protein A [Phycisphaerales bacterium]